MLPSPAILSVMYEKTVSTTPSSHTHLQAYARLQRLCAEIQSGRYPTKAALARAVERSTRTVQNDLRALRHDFSAPLAFDTARNGWYFTDSTWRLPALAEGDLLSFFMAERLLQHLGATSPEVQLVRQAVQRLAQLLPQEVVVDLPALAEAISFAPEPVLDVAPARLQQLALAARQRRTVHIHYYAQYRAEYTERDVDVLLLHNVLGEWYAIGYDHYRQDIRDFHVGRVQNLEVTSRVFTPPPTWDQQAYLRRGFGMFRGGQDVLVEVVFDAVEARYIRERTFHPTQQLQDRPDGGVRLTFETTEAALEQVARWLMQYGPHARALQPPALCTLLRQRLRQAATLYEDGEEEERHG